MTTHSTPVTAPVWQFIASTATAVAAWATAHAMPTTPEQALQDLTDRLQHPERRTRH